MISVHISVLFKMLFILSAVKINFTMHTRESNMNGMSRILTPANRYDNLLITFGTLILILIKNMASLYPSTPHMLYIFYSEWNVLGVKSSLSTINISLL